jgi:hypothetical protein
VRRSNPVALWSSLYLTRGTAGVNNTGDKLFSGVNDTGEKFIAGVVDTGD